MRLDVNKSFSVGDCDNILNEPLANFNHPAYNFGAIILNRKYSYTKISASRELLSIFRYIRWEAKVYRAPLPSPLSNVCYQPGGLLDVWV